MLTDWFAVLLDKRGRSPAFGLVAAADDEGFGVEDSVLAAAKLVAKVLEDVVSNAEMHGLALGLCEVVGVGVEEVIADAADACRAGGDVCDHEGRAAHV